MKTVRNLQENKTATLDGATKSIVNKLEKWPPLLDLQRRFHN